MFLRDTEQSELNYQTLGKNNNLKSLNNSPVISWAAKSREFPGILDRQFPVALIVIIT